MASSNSPRAAGQDRNHRSAGQERNDLHNSNIDQDRAEHDQCGNLDLQTGRSCRRPALHSGSCHFEP